MSTRRSLLLLVMMSGIALPSCMPASPALIDVKLTITSEPGIPAVQLPRTTVSTGETATFTVAGCELHITPSLKHGLVMLQVRIDEPARDDSVKKATEPLVMTTAAGAGRGLEPRSRPGPLFVVAPQPQDFYDPVRLQDLVHKTVLDGYPTRIRAPQVADQFFERRGTTERILGQQHKQGLRLVTQARRNQFAGIFLRLLRVDEPPVHQPNS